MRGESWEDLLSCSLEWTESGADSGLLGAARGCKERWMSSSDDCWALAGDVSPVIDELTQRPLRSAGQTGAPVPSNRHAVPRKQHVKKTSERSRRFVSAADVGEWLRGRANSNQWRVSQQLSNQDRGVINVLVGAQTSLESPLTVWLFICFARLQSLL